jgi:hypothetical protein
MDNFFNRLSRVLSIVGFSILSGLFGLGLTWLVVGIYAKFAIKTLDAQLDFAAKNMPILVVGGVVGFIAGIIVSLRVAKLDPRTKKIIEKKYIGAGGQLYVYFGVPMFVFVLLVFCFGERFLNKVGTATGAYLGIGIFLVVLTTSLVLYDHIPKKLIVPFGILGWLLILLSVIWFFILGPGAIGQSHF